MRPARFFYDPPQWVVAHPPGELHMVAEAGQAGGDIELGPDDGTAEHGGRPQRVPIGGDEGYERLAEAQGVHPPGRPRGQQQTGEPGTAWPRVASRCRLAQLTAGPEPVAGRTGHGGVVSKDVPGMRGRGQFVFAEAGASRRHEEGRHLGRLAEGGTGNTASLGHAYHLEEPAVGRIAVDPSAVPDGDPQAALVVDGHAVGPTVLDLGHHPASRQGAGLGVYVESVDAGRVGVSMKYSVERSAVQARPLEIDTLSTRGTTDWSAPSM